MTSLYATAKVKQVDEDQEQETQVFETAIKHENENYRGGLYVSEYLSTLLVVCVRVKLSAVNVRLIFCENKFTDRNIEYN